MAAITHAAERKAFEVALGSVMKKVGKNRTEGYVEIVNMIEKGFERWVASQSF